MKIKLKLALLCVPFLFVISCSDSNEVQESKVTWDATNFTMYNEFMQCKAGEDYSQEALDEMIDSWRELGLSKSLLGGWGYVSVSPNKSSFNNYWELSWSSKEEADAAWEEWVANKDAIAWSEQSASILQCDGENIDGYEFTFPYDPYAFGESPADGFFAAAFLGEFRRYFSLSYRRLRYLKASPRLAGSGELSAARNRRNRPETRTAGAAQLLRISR